MAEARSRPAWAEVDLSAIRHNTALLRRRAAPAALCAVVKADGYGHGAAPVARAAIEGGAAGLAVATVEEGVELREARITQPVLLLSEPPDDACDDVVAAGLTPTLCTEESVALVAASARRLGTRLAVHVKIDTGMHRLGADPASFAAVVAAVEADSALRLEGVWTHLAVADGTTEEDRRYTAGQLERFERAVAALPSRPRLLHAANSAATLAWPAARYDMVRCGIALYGVPPAAPPEGASPSGTTGRADATGSAASSGPAGTPATPAAGSTNGHRRSNNGDAAGGAPGAPGEGPTEPAPRTGRSAAPGAGNDPLAAAAGRLRPALALRARVVAVRELEAGERPSYGRLRPLPERSVVATVPLGYADGVPRRLFTVGASVLVGGRRRPLAGMITMDQLVVDCGPGANVVVGDEVTLIGPQGDEEVTATEWAGLLGTIGYEVLTGIGPRVPRVYVGEASAGWRSWLAKGGSP